jgi:hypothetical protein
MALPESNVTRMKPPIGSIIESEIFYGMPEKDHEEVEIYVSREDSISWFCREMRFRVLYVLAGERTPKAPLPLFYRPFPSEFAQHVNSGPAQPGRGGYYYKATFEFENAEERYRILDPHIRTHP